MTEREKKIYKIKFIDLKKSRKHERLSLRFILYSYLSVLYFIIIPLSLHVLKIDLPSRY